jgi:Arc/MetJ-type ribon-helix-helix transcriptional regulator
MADYRISVRLTAELKRRIRSTTRQTGTRESDVVRRALERQFAAEDDALTLYQRAEKAGLIGAIRTAPRDLSTNPKHLEKFGGL